MEHYLFSLTLDNEAPTISGMPSNINANTDSGLATTAVSWTAPTASDNSGGAVTLTSTHNPGDTFSIGTTTVTYTATDPNGNEATASFTVTVTGKIRSRCNVSASEVKIYQIDQPVIQFTLYDYYRHNRVIIMEHYLFSLTFR